MILHLNDVPDAVLREARSRADAGGAKAVLMAHTDPACWEYLEPFIEEVVLGAGRAATWRRGQVLVPDVSLADLLRREPGDLLAPLGGAFIHRVRPTVDDWRSGATWTGAPARVLPAADYRFPVPDGAIGLGVADTEDVRDPEVALRRWLAAGLARSARGSGLDSLDSLVASCAGIPPIADWSRDAAIAAAGLLREHEAFGDAVDGVPGMRGPDAWYRGEPAPRPRDAG